MVSPGSVCLRSSRNHSLLGTAGPSHLGLASVFFLPPVSSDTTQGEENGWAPSWTLPLPPVLSPVCAARSGSWHEQPRRVNPSLLVALHMPGCGCKTRVCPFLPSADLSREPPEEVTPDLIPWHFQHAAPPANTCRLQRPETSTSSAVLSCPGSSKPQATPPEQVARWEGHGSQRQPAPGSGNWTEFPEPL